MLPETRPAPRAQKKENEVERGACRTRAMAEAVWTKLRRPFVLCAGCHASHVCEWEVFDVDRAGCLLCSVIHRCSHESCRDVTQTEDATVCNVTGLCVSTANLVQSEYDENIVSYNGGRAGSKPACFAESDDVERYVHELLTSARCEASFRHEKAKFGAKLGACMNSLVCKSMATQTPLNMIQVVERSLGAMKSSRVTEQEFDHEARRRLAALCARQLTLIIAVCDKCMPGRFKKSEMRIIVFGLMYLMRTGVSIEYITVIPRVPSLTFLLPVESNLQRFFDFKAKHITEVENKFKFLLRNLDKHQLLSVGFHII